MEDMWQTIGDVLKSPNAGMVMATVLFLAMLVSLLSRKGILSINTHGLSLGADVQERDIIRQQVEWTHCFVSSLYGTIQPMTDNRFQGYYTRFILETCYSEIVDWITFNHIKIDSEYISIKQTRIKSLIYSHDIDNVFKTPEFEKQIDAWVEEIIKKLATIRELYK